MAVTRIKNNQITDSTIQANAKIQNYTVTSALLANNITYNSDFTVAGNLTVSGNTTTIDTTITTIEDPVILLASTQTGSPTVDIGFIGERGTSDNIAFVWDESADEFVTAFTSTGETNTTISISSYANFHTNDANIGGNLAVGGNITITGNVTSLNVTGNITGGNLLTPGILSATGNLTGGNVITAGAVNSATVSSSGNITGGNLITSGNVNALSAFVNAGAVLASGRVEAGTTMSAAGNITGGNVLTGGLVSATANVTGGNLITAGAVNGATVSASGNITGGNVTTSGITSTGSLTASTTINATGNITGGNVLTGGQVSATGNVTGGNLVAITALVAPALNVTGNITGGNILTAGQVSATGNVTGGNVITSGLTSTGSLTASTTIVATGNVTGGNVLTAGLVSATGNVNGGNLISAALVSGTTVSASGNITGGNLITTGVTSTGTLTTTGNALIGGNLIVQGNITYINIDDLRVEDPIIILGTGPNGAPLTTDDGMDRGIYMEWYKTGLGNSWIGWDNSTGNLVAAADVIFASNNVVTVNSYGTFQAGNLYSQSAVSAGNITGGNLLTAGLVSATGNVNGGNLISAALVQGVTLSATGNVIGGNLTTTGIASVGTLTVTGAGTVGTTLGVTGNITGGNLLTAGLVSATGNVNGGNLIGAALVQGVTVSASGNVIGGNVTTAGLVSATGNVTGGNVTTAGQVVATGNVNGGNVISSALVQGVTVSASGNVIGGNVTTAGQVVATSNITGGNLLTSGLVSATGNVNGGNLVSAALVQGVTVSASGNVIGGNVTTAGLISATGNIYGGNLILAGAALDTTAGRLTVNSTSADADFAINADTVANLFYVDAGTGTVSFGNATQTTNAIVAFNSNRSVLMPVGTTGERPGTGVTGMLRFNTTNDALEIYDNSQWTTVGVPSFTVIQDQQFNGDGVTVAFTINTDQTTNSCIVSINGVVQIPTVAYSVSGTTLTFTEAPLSGDVIDVRQLTTTTTITSISNSSGNAVITVSDTANTVVITGDLIPTGNVASNLGNPTHYWKSLYVGGNTIYLGNLQLKAENGQMAFYLSDGTTPAPISASSVDTSQIASGTSSVAVIAAGGNVRTNIAGATVQTISSTGVEITGNLTVTGNATLSGNILGDRIQNGTTTIDIQSVNGNANITVAGTSNVAVFSTAGANITGTLGVTGNITGGNLSGTSIVGTLTTAAQTNITSVGTLGSLSVTANVAGGNLTTAGQVSATGNITGGNISVGTGTITGGNIVNSNGNGIGNIGSSTTYFNTVFAKATSAQYADLAEKYVADAEYPAGTVVVFGGNKEVTVTSVDADRAVAGVVSTNPSYIMNGGLEAEFVATVALTGRVPCRVTGTVRKGDLMVSAGYGLARAEQDPRVGTVIGKALENFEGNEGVIEVVVGRF